MSKNYIGFEVYDYADLHLTIRFLGDKIIGEDQFHTAFNDLRGLSFRVWHSYLDAFGPQAKPVAVVGSAVFWPLYDMINRRLYTLGSQPPVDYVPHITLKEHTPRRSYMLCRFYQSVDGERYYV